MADGFRPSPRLGQPASKGEGAACSTSASWAPAQGGFLDSHASAAAAEKAQLYKAAAKEAMEQAGIHDMFLEDSHWASLWNKHFERRLPAGDVESGAPMLPFDSSVPPSFEGRTLRVLQWNLLAEGLVPEGFLMPLVSKTHVDGFDEFLSDLLKSGKPEDMLEAARLSVEGHRNVVLRIEESGDQSWEEFARMACEMVNEMKGLPDDQKQARGIDLKYKYDGLYEKKRHYINMVYEDFGQFHKHKEPRVALDGQLSVNEKAVVRTDHRLLRVLWFTALMMPDVVCFQELDNFSFLAEEMSKLGYECGMADAPAYVLLKDRRGATYQERVKSSPWAFAPKSGKKGVSNARKFLEKRVADGLGEKATFMGSDVEWPIDDDGQAIFWRRDRFRLVGGPEFVVLPGDKDMQEFVAGDTGALFNDHGKQAAVRVLLEFTPEGERVEGQQFYVATSHLSSGTDAECARILELRYLQEVWGRPGLPEIWAMDANTEIDFEDSSGNGFLGVSVPGEANALRTFMRHSGTSSVWDNCYDDTKKNKEAPPASVWKMRGSASKQPKKVGEDMYQLIDHIFFNGRGLFSSGSLALRLREKLKGNHNDRDWLALMPNELLPSDHLPIVWDFEVASCPRREAAVILGQAQRLWRKLLGTMGGDMDAGVMEEMRELLYLRDGIDTPTADSSATPTFPPTETDLFQWLALLTKEASAVLGISTDITDKIRGECIARKGKRSSEDLHCCILTAHLFAVGATLLADMPPKSIGSTCAWTNGLCPMSLVGALETMSLAALRNLGRAQILAWKRCENNRYDNALSGLAAQLIENLYGGPGRCRCPRIVEVFDRQGKLSSAALDELLMEVKHELESTVSNKAPACLALRTVDWKTCGTGFQVSSAVRMLLNMLEAGGIVFHEKNTEDFNITASFNMIFSPTMASGKGAAAASAIRLNNLLEQSFDESTVVSAFSGLAKSGNFDSGGGLALLFQSLTRQLAIVERFRDGRGRPEREARALDRPDPITLAAFIRRATISACEEVWPISVLMVATQKLDFRTIMQPQPRRPQPNRCPAYDLVQALRQFPNRDDSSQIITLRRILRILISLCKAVGADDMLPPVVHGDGMSRFKEILFALQRLDEDAQLRWQTLATLTQLLDLLLHSAEPGSMLSATLQGKVRAAVEEPTFKMLLLQRPALESNSWPYDMRQVLENIDEFELVKQLTSSPQPQS